MSAAATTSASATSEVAAARRGDRLALVGLIALVALVYGRTVTFGFTNWDDPQQIVHNPLVRHPLSQGWSGLLWSPPVAMGYPQPLTIVSQHVDGLVGGGRAWPFHVGNLALHLASAMLLWSILRTLVRDRLGAFFGAALFAVHPIVAECVCWATGRKDLLAVAAVLAGLRAHLSLRADLEPRTDLSQRADTVGGRRRALAWVVLLSSLACALASKPWGVVLPVLVAWELLARRAARPMRAGWGFVGLGGLVSVGWVALSIGSQARVGALVTMPWSERPAFVLQHAALQVRNVVAPLWLSPLYSFERLPRGWLSPWGLAGLGVAVAFAVALIFALRRRADPWAFALGGCAIAFAPSSGVVPLQRGPADTYAYGVMPFVALLLALAVVRLRAQLGPIVAGAALSVFALLGFDQAGAWRSSSTLWERALEQYPDAAAAVMAYAESLVFDGRAPLAVRALEEGLRRHPDEPLLLQSLGYACFQASEWPCSLRGYGALLRRGSDPASAFRFLSAWERRPDPAWSVEHARARSLAIDALSGVATDEDAVRLFRRSLGQDDVPVPALRALRDDPKVGPAAARLLAQYGLK